MYESWIHWWHLSPERQTFSTVFWRVRVFVTQGQQQVGWAHLMIYLVMALLLGLPSSRQVGYCSLSKRTCHLAPDWNHQAHFAEQALDSFPMVLHNVPMDVPEDISGHQEQRKLEIALLLPNPGWTTSNSTDVQELWGSRHLFLKEACLMHGTFGVAEKFTKCAVPDSFFQEGFGSIFFQESAFSYSLEYVISWCLYLFLSQNRFYSISIYRLLWGTKWSHCKVTHSILPPAWSTSVWLQDSYSWSYFL